MKISKLFVSMALAAVTISGMAQEGTAQQEKDENKKAEVVDVNGQQRLVLKTGLCTSTGACVNLEIKMDGELWKTLDSLVTAPTGGDAIRTKDISGCNVEIARANVNSKPGLMFTSGTKYVAITKEEFKSLKKEED